MRLLKFQRLLFVGICPSPNSFAKVELFCLVLVELRQDIHFHPKDLREKARHITYTYTDRQKKPDTDFGG